MQIVKTVCTANAFAVLPMPRKLYIPNKFPRTNKFMSTHLMHIVDWSIPETSFVPFASIEYLLIAQQLLNF